VAPDTSRGGALTATVNEQVPRTPLESTPVQVTVVDPTGNIESLDGAHVICTGGVPPVAVAAPKRIAIGRPDKEVCAIGPGHDSASGSAGGGGGVGVVGLSLHALAASGSDKAKHTAARRRRKVGRPKICYRPTIAVTSITGQEVV
jgi:hypothetical protein